MIPPVHPKTTHALINMLAFRRKVCKDTISRSASIASSTPGGSLDSHFIPNQLPPPTKSSPTFPNLTPSPIPIHDIDAFALARDLPSRSPTPGKPSVLNLASDREPGGGWRYTLRSTQEEALCYFSTLYATLKPERYPWLNMGAASCAGIHVT
jgi:hypothetical protein